MSRIGISTTSKSTQSKLESWRDELDRELLVLKQIWEEANAKTKYQIIGDNWDKRIIPTYRTSSDKTVSLHLFNVIAVVDRIVPNVQNEGTAENQMNVQDFIPSVPDQCKLKSELTFIVAKSVLGNLEQVQAKIGRIYPNHLNHRYSHKAGDKTTQV